MRSRSEKTAAWSGRSGRAGTAMTETAILCFFIYAPMLMMVIVWGDMTLDKERAHTASAYMAFAPEPMDDAALVNRFFPTATGQSDGTRSVRTVAVEADEMTEGPVYTLPGDTTRDYEGPPPDFDLQYRLYSLAVGEVHITYELTAFPDGSVGFVATARRDQSEAGRYLSREGIVNVGELPGSLGPFPAGETIDIDTEAVSTRYTHYVETLTDMFSGNWNASGEVAGGLMNDAVPTLESRAGIRTRFKSPFLWELERESYGGVGEEAGGSEKLPRIDGDPGFEMHFGATGLIPEDDSFRTGYTYLRNPGSSLPGGRLRNDLYELSGRMFEHEGHRIHELQDPLSSERGERHLAFLEPGDPREQED